MHVVLLLESRSCRISMRKCGLVDHESCLSFLSKPTNALSQVNHLSTISMLPRVSNTRAKPTKSSTLCHPRRKNVALKHLTYTVACST
jgi:hypothetical protein